MKLAWCKADAKPQPRAGGGVRGMECGVGCEYD